MWIKKLYATFGKLEDKTLEFSPGLNIVYGKNESGKSTWSAFIKAMFYGISTREQKKAGFIPDKEKFLPWSGSPMYGKMELSTSGGDMTIERTSARAGVFSKVTSRYDESGKEAPTGEELVGVSSSVYERTAFIRQAGIEVSGDSETERRILSIASSGDESISAGEVIARLKKKQRELRSTGKNGEIQRLEKEASLLRERIEAAEQAEAEISQLSESIKAYRENETRAKRRLSIARAEEEKNKLSYIQGARNELQETLVKVQELENAPARRELDIFVQKKSELSKLVLSYEQNEKLYSVVSEELSDCRREMHDSAFSGMSREAAQSAAEKACAVLDACDKKKKTLKPLAFILLIAAVLLVACAIAFYALLFIPAAFFIGAGIGLFVADKKRSAGEKTSLEIKEKYKVSDSAELSRSVERYISALEREGELAKKESETAFAKKETRAAIALHEEDIKELLARFSINIESLDEAEIKLRKAVEERENAQSALRTARARVEALDAAAEVSEKSIEYTDEEIPEEPPAFFEDELLVISERIRAFEIALAAERARLSDFSREEAVLHLQTLSENLERANAEYDALCLAIDTIDEAETELKNRFSPEIEKRTSELFQYLSGGSFKLVRIKNSDFDVDVAAGEASTPRDGLNLSRGTLDELYFALRIALFETIIPEASAPPIILDDALVNFDNERMERTLTLLLEIAKKRQVILLSCHKREAEHLRDNPLVRITEL